MSGLRNCGQFADTRARGNRKCAGLACPRKYVRAKELAERYNHLSPIPRAHGLLSKPLWAGLKVFWGERGDF